MTSRWFAIFALVLVLTAMWARGQAVEPKPSDCLKEEHAIRPPRMDGGGNAAWEYFKVWDSLPKAEYEAISFFNNTAYLQNDPPKLTPAQRELCLKHQDYIDGLIRCASMPVCDWGVQHQFGEELRLPHLKLMRDAYRALVMDYDRCFEDKNATGAAARLAAMVRTADQTSTDHMWISVLTGTSIVYGTFDRTHDFLKSGMATPATVRVVLAAFKSIKLDDLFGWIEAMGETRWEETQWPRGVCKGEWAGATYLDKTDDLNWYGWVWPRMYLLTRNERQLNTDLDRFDAYFAKALPLWKDPANDLALRELETEALEGQFGLVASYRASDIEHTRRSMLRARRQILQVVGELEAYLKKEDGRQP